MLERTSFVAERKAPPKSVRRAWCATHPADALAVPVSGDPRRPLTLPSAAAFQSQRRKRHARGRAAKEVLPGRS
jgi:hypothetical protein